MTEDEQWERARLAEIEDLFNRDCFSELAAGYCHEGLRDQPQHSDCLDIGICNYMLSVPDTTEGRETALRWVAVEILRRARRGELGC